MKLTKRQREVLKQFEPGEWYTVVDLKTNRTTLGLLCKLGLIERRRKNIPAELRYSGLIPGMDGGAMYRRVE